MSRKPLTVKELEEKAEKLFDSDNDSEIDPVHASSSSDPDYTSSDIKIEENEMEMTCDGTEESISDEDQLQGEEEEEVAQQEEEAGDELELGANEEQEQAENIWFVKDGRFISRLQLPQQQQANCNLARNLTEVDIFLKVFPKSLLMNIASCTNLRLEQFEKDSKKKRILTDYHEIMLLLGVTLIMSYNRVPTFNDYWSQNESLGNTAIKKAMSRDRCKLLLFKIYFNEPVKPTNADKLYYIEDVVNCLKTTFRKFRTEATFQSIDESMAKFKGRSALKQYLTMKPVKRGKKVFFRLLMTSVLNARILFNDLQRKEKSRFLLFLITLAEGLISLGRENTAVKRKPAVSLGRPTIKNGRCLTLVIIYQQKEIHAEDANDVLFNSKKKNEQQLYARVVTYHYVKLISHHII